MFERTCPVCKQECDRYEVSFSKEGTWCNHAGWVLRTGLTRDDAPILSSIPLTPAAADGV